MALPETLEACHKEIQRLQKRLDTRDSILNEIVEIVAPGSEEDVLLSGIPALVRQALATPEGQEAPEEQQPMAEEQPMAESSFCEDGRFREAFAKHFPNAAVDDEFHHDVALVLGGAFLAGGKSMTVVGYMPSKPTYGTVCVPTGCFNDPTYDFLARKVFTLWRTDFVVGRMGGSDATAKVREARIRTDFPYDDKWAFTTGFPITITVHKRSGSCKAKARVIDYNTINKKYKVTLMTSKGYKFRITTASFESTIAQQH